jgi:hypothetical protein
MIEELIVRAREEDADEYTFFLPEEIEPGLDEDVLEA